MATETQPETGQIITDIPVLPSGEKISYSEVSTFRKCALQHYYRYFLRLKSKRYSERRHLEMGTVVHNAIEQLYEGEVESRYDKQDTQRDLMGLVHAEVARCREKYDQHAWREWFDPEQFELDMAAAIGMFGVFAEFLWRREPFDIIEPEVEFEAEIGGYEFLGKADALLRVHEGQKTLSQKTKRAKKDVPAGIYIGEVKTRGASFSSRVRTKARKDLQTKIYTEGLEQSGHPALSENGCNIEGTIRTILLKPPKDLLQRDEDKSLDEQVKAIREFYDFSGDEEPEFRTHYRQEIVPLEVDRDELASQLNDTLLEMGDFYEDPYGSFLLVDKPYQFGFPCGWCPYNLHCHDSKPLDDSFSYKRKREA